MTTVCPLAQEKIWFDKPKYDLAEKKYYERLAKLQKGSPNPNQPNPTPNPAKPVQSKAPKEPKGDQGRQNDKTKVKPAPKPDKGDPKEPAQAPKMATAPAPTPVIPTDPSAPDTAKKESKKAKKSKKERHRNRAEEKGAPTQNGNPLNSLAGEVAKARQHIKNSLQCIDDIANMTSPSAVIEVNNRLNSLEKENSDLKQKVVDLTSMLSKLEIRIKDLEKGGKPASTVASQAVANTAHAASLAVAKTTTTASQKSPAKAEDDDDGVDLFASESEEEDEEATKIKEQRLAEYAAKKSKKPALIAKSSIILDVKPWDDETDMKEMEKHVREISADGLLWGASKLVPLAYGIHKLQINCVVEDDKISIDWLQETIEAIEDYVQSVDIAAFNKI